MELFVIIANGFQPLFIITKCTILDVAADLDLRLLTVQAMYGWLMLVCVANEDFLLVSQYVFLIKNSFL